ncbi:hypothetical protein L596_012122 [Steinernema carpocapsae]|nr:hypothetical protein L596_012122 [Steinernema carpocapsae]
MNELACKRDSLSKMCVNGFKQPSTSARVSLTPVVANKDRKKKRIILSSDEEPELSDAESEESLESSPVKKKKNLPVRSAAKQQKPPAVVKPPEDKLRTLDDTSDEEDEWLSKPRLQANSPVFKPVKLPPPPSVKFVAKRSRINSISSEEEFDPSKNTLKAVVKRARNDVKRRKIGDVNESSGDEFELPEDIFSVQEADDAEEIAAMERQFDSDESEDEQENRKTSTDIKVVHEQCLNAFNTFSRDDLVTLPRSNEKLADFIVANRPFTSFAAMERKMESIGRGATLLESQMEHFQNRGVLDKILDDCEQSAKQIQAELSRMAEQNIEAQPRTLHSDCTLHAYQKIGLGWMIMMERLGFSGILADEMGLGKTIQVIAFFTHLKETGTKGPHLIIVPSSTIENWMDEIAKWSPTLHVETYYGSQAERSEIAARAKVIRKGVDVLLTTYNMVCSKPSDRKFFKKFDINYIVYDEGHMLKSCSTARYQTLMKVKGKKKLLLTGTPLQNNLCELISLMYFTMPKFFSRYCEDINQLLKQFQVKQQSARGDNPTAIYEKSTIDQAKAILAPFVLRRLKANVLDTLPKKLENLVKVEMTDIQKDMYRTRVLDLRLQKKSGDYSSAGGLMQLRQIANHPLMTRRLYDEEKLEKIAKILCLKEREYLKKKPEHVAEDLSFSSDFQIHQLCLKFRSISHFQLEPEESLCSGKCEKMDRILPEIKNRGEKVLIFSQFTSLLDILEVYLNVHGHRFCRLDGATPVMERQELINEFNSNPDIFVFLLSTRAGGMGINLTAANNIILHDIDFNPYNDKQAEDRCHRMGQKRNVNIYRFITRGTIEEGMFAAAKQKLELERDVTGRNNGDDKADAQLVEALLTKALAMGDD